METIIYIVAACLLGGFIGYLIAKSALSSHKNKIENELIATKTDLQNKQELLASKEQENLECKNNIQTYIARESDFAHQISVATTNLAALEKVLVDKNTEIDEYKKKQEEVQTQYIDLQQQASVAFTNLETCKKTESNRSKELEEQKKQIQASSAEISILNKQLAEHKANLQAVTKTLSEREAENSSYKKRIEELSDNWVELNKKFAEANANLLAAEETITVRDSEFLASKKEIEKLKNSLSEIQQLLATEKSTNQYLNERLSTQKEEMENLGKKFNTEFENIASKILETKSEKFTEVNKSNLTAILEPLGKNLTEFKSKVEEVYSQEAKERFSLAEKVKELAELNQKISTEAHNLTKALKGDSKIQGNWGEVILENILERSGLTKDREYFLQKELTDEAGKPLLSESEGKKMRPDAIVKYPGNRQIIIDSKVSLNAYIRMVESTDTEEQNNQLRLHIVAVKNHIDALSTKAYDDYSKTLDFVFMFVPNEAAYNAALQGDSNLWHYAYEKRILLLSPTNLITSLKLTFDLWHREYQNQNVKAIAEQGGKLYDKFVRFVRNLEDIGNAIKKAHDKYDNTYNLLKEGRGNLILQAEKLHKLGVKSKNALNPELVHVASIPFFSPLPAKDDESIEEDGDMEKFLEHELPTEIANSAKS